MWISIRFRSHARAILSRNPWVGVVQADLRRPVDITDHPDVANLLDFSEPVAVVLLSVLHFISDDYDPYGIVARFLDAVVAGSYIALAHGPEVPELAEAMKVSRRLYQRTPTPAYPCAPAEIARLLTGLDIVEPGIVPITDWRPDPGDGAGESWPSVLVAVARKP